MIREALSLPALLVIVAVATAQAPAPLALRLSATTDTTSVKTTGSITLTVTAQVPSGWNLDPIDPVGSLPDGWTIASNRGPLTRTEQAGGTTTMTWTYGLEPFLPGQVEIKPIKATARPRPASGATGAATNPAPDAPPITAETLPIRIEVHSVLSDQQDAAQPADIRGVVDPREPFPWLMVGGVVTGLAAVSVAAWWLISRARRRAAERVITRPAHEIALEHLARLLEKDYLTPGREKFKEFYAEASDILRTYIEDRFHIHAPERTTEEFLADAKASAALRAEDVSTLGRFLGACDMVKFARHTPDSGDAQRAAHTIREFVEMTRTPEALVIVSGPGASVRTPAGAAVTPHDEPIREAA